MRKSPRSITAMISVIALSSFAFSAPIAPHTREIPEEFLSLAHLKKINLAIPRLSPEFQQIGFSREELALDWTKKLTKAGIEVDKEDYNAPLLWVHTMATGDRDLPNGIGFTIHLKLFQRVHVKRLGREFLLPTYTQVAGGLDNTPDLARTVQGQFDLLIQMFIDISKRVTSQVDLPVDVLPRENTNSSPKPPIARPADMPLKDRVMTVKKRLEELKKLHDTELITPEQYEEKQAKILNDF